MRACSRSLRHIFENRHRRTLTLMTSSSPHQLYSPVSRSQFHAIRNLNLNASLAVVVFSTCRLRGDFSCSCVCVHMGNFLLLFDLMYFARQGYRKGKCCCGALVECTWGVLRAELLTYHDRAMVLNDSRLIRIVASFVSLLQERGTSSVPDQYGPVVFGALQLLLPLLPLPLLLAILNLLLRDLCRCCSLLLTKRK